MKNINPEDMMKDTDAMQDMIQDGDLTDIINSLESVLKDPLDKHAPALTKTLTTRKSNPWFTEEVRSQKRLLRKMERTYFRYKTKHLGKILEYKSKAMGTSSKRLKQKRYQITSQNVVMTPKIFFIKLLITF